MQRRHAKIMAVCGLWGNLSGAITTVSSRLSSLLQKTEGRVVYKADGEPNREEKFLPPHVLEISHGDELTKEEIFGPLLPIITVKSFDEALTYVSDGEKSLGAYIFTRDAEKAKRFVREVSSGGKTVNDVMSHAFVRTLPFGGVGNSGFGRIHGKYAFDSFMHEKPILIRNGLDLQLNWFHADISGQLIPDTVSADRSHEIEKKALLANTKEVKAFQVSTPPHMTDDDELVLVPEPLGVVLIIAPWNFPLVTSIPFAAALAGGNTVILKLSEVAPAFSTMFAGLVGKYFDKRLFAAVEGAVPETTTLLKERFDHIMYTGNPTVGRIVMAAAAKNLTPVTLELGGKNPVLIDPDADIEDAAKKIIFSKTYNCGQICLSSDYVLTTEEVKQKLIAALAKQFDAMAPIKEHKDYGRITLFLEIQKAVELLRTLKEILKTDHCHFQPPVVIAPEDQRSSGPKADGEPNREEKFLPPHVLEISHGDELAKEEIFGPLLPILTVKSYDEALAYVNDREKSLGAYIFTKSPEKVKRFIREVSSGGKTVNDVMSHAFCRWFPTLMANRNSSTANFSSKDCYVQPHPTRKSTLPFGGVGNSGIGRIHGKYAFDSFVHEKPILVRNALGKELMATL
ncbi:unnamed protein product [Heligmosomoides polygyrus]|uniref:Aldehyde dehydrogenase n=1 Tax=Heligmosomoides polygyrus TaxID=6339 RepID=A0A3P8AS12_HELPZ|nr:unnamed protein product [Heligmosomoides polygyrus]